MRKMPCYGFYAASLIVNPNIRQARNLHDSAVHSGLRSLSPSYLPAQDTYVDASLRMLGFTEQSW